MPNSIFFKFTQGSGVLGEAGPEAIMPLRRRPDGSLKEPIPETAAHPKESTNV